MLKVAIIAGEPSGDMLAAGLISELKRQYIGEIQFFGIGGDRMAQQGFVSSYNMEILSIGGYGLDVIGAIPKLLWLRQKIIKQIIAFAADVFIGIDAPDFNFYIEKKLKCSGIKTVHYVSPTIWAWRYGRIFKIKKSTDLMLCIFPMEEALYAKEHIRAKFVGHQLADEIDLDINTLEYKKKLGLDGVVFSILVGSRKSEIKNLAQLFISTCNLIAQVIPEATFLFPLVNQSLYDLFLEQLNHTRITFRYRLLINQTRTAICASDIVLAKSGTVTLEVALCKKPLLISYKVSKFTEWLLRKKLYIKYVGLPNILLNEEVAQELLQDAATPNNLAQSFISLYNDKARQQVMLNKFYHLHHMLRNNASYSAAHAVLQLISYQ
ncbi:MAG: lipid-A-disaccharide synthase [Burkholderiales bacterium]|nr:lipid-A-disaccharide synthase [Burkholderiales bacterium]